MYTKKHLISMLGYLGIGFIGGSISHGFFSGTRSIIMAIVGILLFILSEYLKGGVKDYTQLLVGGLIFSIAVGMVSGGLQHFLDSPLRSLWIVPVGWIISTAIFPYKEEIKTYNMKKSLLVGGMISLCLRLSLYGLLHIVPDDIFGDHHAGETTEDVHID